MSGPPEDCTGKMLCECELCRAEVAHRVKHLTRRAKRTSQPWDALLVPKKGQNRTHPTGAKHLRED